MEQANFERGQLLEIECQMLALQAKVKGMEAENRGCEMRGEYPQYYVDAFEAIATDLDTLSNLVHEMIKE